MLAKIIFKYLAEKAREKKDYKTVEKMQIKLWNYEIKGIKPSLYLTIKWFIKVLMEV